jgi:hypothetical protein
VQGIAVRIGSYFTQIFVRSAAYITGARMVEENAKEIVTFLDGEVTRREQASNARR